MLHHDRAAASATHLQALGDAPVPQAGADADAAPNPTLGAGTATSEDGSSRARAAYSHAAVITGAAQPDAWQCLPSHQAPANNAAWSAGAATSYAEMTSGPTGPAPHPHPHPDHLLLADGQEGKAGFSGHADGGPCVACALVRADAVAGSGSCSGMPAAAHEEAQRAAAGQEAMLQDHAPLLAALGAADPATAAATAAGSPGQRGGSAAAVVDPAMQQQQQPQGEYSPSPGLADTPAAAGQLGDGGAGAVAPGVVLLPGTDMLFGTKHMTVPTDAVRILPACLPTEQCHLRTCVGCCAMQTLYSTHGCGLTVASLKLPIVRVPSPDLPRTHAGACTPGRVARRGAGRGGGRERRRAAAAGRAGRDQRGAARGAEDKVRRGEVQPECLHAGMPSSHDGHSLSHQHGTGCACASVLISLRQRTH